MPSSSICRRNCLPLSGEEWLEPGEEHVVAVRWSCSAQVYAAAARCAHRAVGWLGSLRAICLGKARAWGSPFGGCCWSLGKWIEVDTTLNAQTHYRLDCDLGAFDGEMSMQHSLGLVL